MEREQLMVIVRRTFLSQRFGVFASISAGQPYLNLVAFANSDDLKYLYFVTPRETQKYANLRSANKVSMLMDNRNETGFTISSGVAITVMGDAITIEHEQYDEVTTILKQKHTQLGAFISNPENALINVIVNYYIVAGFDYTYTLPMIKSS